MQVATDIKLNLGSRTRSIDGFTNIDCDPHEGVDVVADVSDLSMYKDGEVSEIYASHILEHFPHPQTLKVLTEWCRVMKKDGILYVAVPDFERTCQIYQKYGMCDWVVNYLWGDQLYQTAFHYAGFDFKWLNALLINAGFSEASQVIDFPIGSKKDCSRNLFAEDLKPVSLNVVAVK